MINFRCISPTVLRFLEYCDQHLSVSSGPCGRRSHPERTARLLRACGLALGMGLIAAPMAQLARAADLAPPIGKDAARKLPLADVHFHIMSWMKLPDLLQQMDRNNIRWAGGANPAIPGNATAIVQANKEASSLLGKRYLQFTGQGQWLTLKQQGGVAALENADGPAFRERLAIMDSQLASGVALGIGEIHVNSADTAPMELVRVRIRGDAPTLMAMLDLAARHQRPLAVHVQWDRDTVEQLARLAAHNRQGMLWLSHCGATASAEQLRAFLRDNPNVWCDISYRSPPQLRGNAQRNAIFDRSGLKSDWRQLIEDMPERFMLGIDDVEGGWSTWQEVVDTLREGLLASLTAETAERVAWKNARTLLRLD